MYRFFEEKASILDGKIVLSKENSHHIRNVLRMKDDEDFELVIGKEVYLVNIFTRDKDFVQVVIKDSWQDKNESDLKIHLYQGLPKSDKLDLIIQKCVELGAFEITPFISSRTIVKWDEKKEERKLRRYEDIALAAAKQSKRGIIPKVNALKSFKDLIEAIRDDFTIIAYENSGQTLRKTLMDFSGDTINIIVGPEGGFSEEEVSQIQEAGAKIVNLGNRILRTETAAIALCAMVQYEVGDINEEV
ncbi:MAG: 16S rRNA (uracil(1498)-N(3))-methyltransferase [Tissierellia bacterium]|nr:16S rRNA (uracil(1498)-N(3))-methyltransferase [Tissierellia bacterium]